MSAQRNARARRLVARLLAGAVALFLAYGAAGLIGGAFPANAAWRPPAAGVTIWVENNGVHTSLVMPKVAAGVDWRPLAPAADVKDPLHTGHDHLAVGWGDHDFYLSTPTWWDVRPGPVLRAAIGSRRTLLHVEHVPRPVSGPDVRPVLLRPEEYRNLAAFVRASLGSRRRWPGYGPHDAFHEGRGHYSAVTTCNEWTGAALRTAGVRVGQWTPFSRTVLWWFPVEKRR